MPTTTIANGQLSGPHTIAPGVLVTVTPSIGASALVEYTNNPLSDISNGIATWKPWPNGTVGSTSQALCSKRGFLRVTATGGPVTLDTNFTPTNDQLAAYQADWGPSSSSSSSISVAPVSLVSNTSPMTALTNTTYPTQLGSFNLPAGALTSNKVLQVAVAGTNNNSANAKNVWMTIGGVQVGPTVTNTTGTAISGSFNVSNNGSMQAQSVAANFASGTLSTGYATSTTFDTTKDQQVVIWGQLTNSGDNISLPTVTGTIGTAPTLTGSSVLYGVNGHYTYTATPTQIIAALKAIGATTYRFDVYPDVPQSLTNAIAMAQGLQGSGIQMYCLLGASMESNPSSHIAYTSESAAFNACAVWAKSVVQALYPLGVKMYECGNELDAASAGGTAIRPTIASAGTVPNDFVSSVWPLFRGVVCGLIAGVRAGNPSAIVCSNAFTNASIYAADALWNGLQPDGTSGYMQARWDVTAWHLYTQGDATNVFYSGGGGQPQFNLLDYISKAYGKPLMISEWHPSQGTDALNATVCTQYLNTWYGNRAKYNILGSIIYSLYDSPFWLIPGGAGSLSLNLLGTAYQSFIASHKG